MSISFILSKNEKVKYHIRMKTHKLIVLRFWIGGDVNSLCVDLIHVSLMFYLSNNHLSKDSSVISKSKIVVFFGNLLSKNLSILANNQLYYL